MKVQVFEEGASSGIYRVGLENGSLFFFRDSYLGEDRALAGRLAPGISIEEEEAALLSFACECLLIERHAHRLIARQEHSRRMLEAKLLRREYPEGRVILVLDELQRQGLLDDRRYGTLYAESLLRRSPLGRKALETKLHTKGLDRATVQLVLDRMWTLECMTETLERACAKYGLDARRLDMEGKSRLLKDGFRTGEIREYAERLD